jgi:hypothetical protein
MIQLYGIGLMLKKQIISLEPRTLGESSTEKVDAEKRGARRALWALCRE